MHSTLIQAPSTRKSCFLLDSNGPRCWIRKIYVWFADGCLLRQCPPIYSDIISVEKSKLLYITLKNNILSLINTGQRRIKLPGRYYFLWPVHCNPAFSASFTKARSKKYIRSLFLDTSARTAIYLTGSWIFYDNRVSEHAKQPRIWRRSAEAAEKGYAYAGDEHLLLYRILRWLRHYYGTDGTIAAPFQFEQCSRNIEHLYIHFAIPGDSQLLEEDDFVPQKGE